MLETETLVEISDVSLSFCFHGMLLMECFDSTNFLCNPDGIICLNWKKKHRKNDDTPCSPLHLNHAAMAARIGVRKGFDGVETLTTEFLPVSSCQLTDSCTIPSKRKRLTPYETYNPDERNLIETGCVLGGALIWFEVRFCEERLIQKLRTIL